MFGLLLFVTACGTATSGADELSPQESPTGFDREVVLVSVEGGDDDSQQIERCVWVARTAEQRQQGLMNVNSIGDADGMLFVQDNPTAGAFWMKDTLIDLSIAYFDENGVVLGTTDMTPCTSRSGDCPRYSTPPNYLFALEVPQGTLEAVGVIASTTMTLTGQSCSAATLSD